MKMLDVVLVLLLLCAVLIDLSEGSKKAIRDPVVEEFRLSAHLRPTKCQVCRVMVQELQFELNKTKDSKEQIMLTNGLDAKKRKLNQLSYQTSELRLMDALENVCKNTKDYRAIAGSPFPYLKNVKSMFRQKVEGLEKISGLNLKPDAPIDAVDDPTFEISRLNFHCTQMIEEFEDEINDWFHHDQLADPLDYICKKKILATSENSCLTASTKQTVGESIEEISEEKFQMKKKIQRPDL